MSLTSSDLKLFCSQNMPEDDISTSGGTINTQVKPEFTQMTANSVIAIVSDGADTRNVTITGRRPNGVIDSETLTLNGTTEVVGTKTFERLLKVMASTTSASRTITIKQGSGGSTLGTIEPNMLGFRIVFYNSKSESATVKRFEKLCWKNVHDSLALTDAVHRLSADPLGKIRVGLDTAKNSSSSVSNRKTVPSGVTFVDDNVDQSVPSGYLDAGEFIGVWIEQTLAANDPAAKGSFTLQLSGASI
jgi:hypothetical protein